MRKAFLDQVNLRNKVKEVSFFFFLIITYLFIYFWLRWVFIAVRRLSLVAASRGYSLLCERLIAVASLVAEHGL